MFKHLRKYHLTILQLVLIITVLLTFIVTVTTQWYKVNLKQEQVTTQEMEPGGYTTRIIATYVEIPKNNSHKMLSSGEINIVKSEFETRKKILADLCPLYKDEKTRLDHTLSNMIIDLKHKVSWCPIYKAASSTWMRNFAALGGALSDTIMNLVHRNIIQLNAIVRQRFPYNMDVNSTYEKLQQTKKFLIVRHPLERIISAYRDKLEHANGRDYYYRKFGRHIVYKYRHNTNENETKIEPTFVEFLKFIVKEKYFDEHWAPFYDTCQPCKIQYDYILKFETFDNDQQVFLQETGLHEYLYYNNEFKNTNPHGATTRNIVKEYLKNVPASLLDEVYKIYENDYKLFSYLPLNFE